MVQRHWFAVALAVLVVGSAAIFLFNPTPDQLAYDPAAAAREAGR